MSTNSLTVTAVTTRLRDGAGRERLVSVSYNSRLGETSLRPLSPKTLVICNEDFNRLYLIVDKLTKGEIKI